MCWLHRAAYSCPEELAKGEITPKYVLYCNAASFRHDLEHHLSIILWSRLKKTVTKYINLMRNNRVDPHVVFDGGQLPMKGGIRDTHAWYV